MPLKDHLTFSSCSETLNTGLCSLHNYAYFTKTMQIHGFMASTCVVIHYLGNYLGILHVLQEEGKLDVDLHCQKVTKKLQMP